MDACDRLSDITSTEMTLFADIIGVLRGAEDVDEIRQAILPALVRLLRADGGCSFVWNSGSGRFHDVRSVGIDPAIHQLYVQYYQFCDPMTFRMRDCRSASIVDEILERDVLVRTDFYNDMLRQDRLEWGINSFCFDENGKDLSDLRIWRRETSDNFERREKILLNTIMPLFRSALLRTRHHDALLTGRERDVVRLLVRGCTDRDIARILGISFGTVRTHVNNAIAKYDASNRAELAALFVRRAC